MKTTYKTYRDPVNAALEKRQRVSKRRARTGALITGAVLAGGLMLGGSGLMGRIFGSSPSCAAPAATQVRHDSVDLIATGVYEGGQTAKADSLQRSLESFGYTVERQVGERGAPVGPPCPQARLLIHTPDYAREKALLMQLTRTPDLLPEDGLANLVPGRKEESGGYRFFPIDDYLERLVDRYVADTGKVKKETARRVLLQYLDPIIRQESGYKHWVRSGADARGLMQVTPDTAVTVRNERRSSPEFAAFRARNPQHKTSALSAQEQARLQYVPLVNLDDGVAILWRNYARCDGDMTCALASYNAGPGNADRWESIPETRQYVRSIHAMAQRTAR